jgi:hypothetical protein
MNMLFEIPSGWYYYDHTNRPVGPFESRDEAEESLLELLVNYLGTNLYHSTTKYEKNG